MTEWRERFKGLQFLCYALEHQYTDAELKLSTLKGHDYPRVQNVVESARDPGEFCVLLGSMAKVVITPGDEGGENEEELRLQRIVNLNGIKLGESLLIEEDSLLQNYLYKNRDYDTEEGGGLMGNQQADIDRSYLDTVSSKYSTSLQPLLT